MNRRILATGFWIVFASLAFALGWFLKPVGGPSVLLNDRGALVGQSAAGFSILDSEYGSPGGAESSGTVTKSRAPQPARASLSPTLISKSLAPG